MENCSLIEQLESKGYAQLKNFLSDQQANRFRRKILSTNDHRAWDIITTPYQPFVINKDRVSSHVIDSLRHKKAKTANRRGQFSFSFFRSNNKHNQQHQSSNIHGEFSQSLLKRLDGVIDIEGELVDAFFASFIRDQFIGYHSDGNIGKYAFIYQLSKGWQRKYGGQLVLYPKQTKFHKITLEPAFNSLTLLNLSFPMFHSVSRLNNPAHKHRITISGWIK